VLLAGLGCDQGWCCVGMAPTASLRMLRSQQSRTPIGPQRVGGCRLAVQSSSSCPGSSLLAECRSLVAGVRGFIYSLAGICARVERNASLDGLLVQLIAAVTG